MCFSASAARVDVRADFVDEVAFWRVVHFSAAEHRRALSVVVDPSGGFGEGRDVSAANRGRGYRGKRSAEVLRLAVAGSGYWRDRREQVITG